jgi:hypothetical protein
MAEDAGHVAALGMRDMAWLAKSPRAPCRLN